MTNGGESAAPWPAMQSCSTCPIRQESDHRIANQLAMLASFVQLKSGDLALGHAESVRLFVRDIVSQINTLAHLHRALTAPYPSRIDLSEHLDAICAFIASSLPDTIRLVTDFQPRCLVEPDQVVPLTQIVNEVVTNAVKHAARPDGPSTIRAVSTRGASGGVRISISDDGPGFPAGFAFGGGRGKRLIEGLGRQIGAQIEFLSRGDGVKFSLSLPPRAPSA